jgi:hypothetical protein
LVAVIFLLPIRSIRLTAVRIVTNDNAMGNSGTVGDGVGRGDEELRADVYLSLLFEDYSKHYSLL